VTFWCQKWDWIDRIIALMDAKEVIPPHFGHGGSNGTLLLSEEMMDANHEKMLAKMASFHEKTDARNSKLDVHHEKMIASQKRPIAKMDAWLAEM
jgi:hypothetical protein